MLPNNSHMHFIALDLDLCTPTKIVVVTYDPNEDLTEFVPPLTAHTFSSLHALRQIFPKAVIELDGYPQTDAQVAAHIAACDA